MACSLSRPSRGAAKLAAATVTGPPASRSPLLAHAVTARPVHGRFRRLTERSVSPHFGSRTSQDLVSGAGFKSSQPEPEWKNLNLKIISMNRTNRNTMK